MNRKHLMLVMLCLASLSFGGCVKDLVGSENFRCEDDSSCVSGYICDPTVKLCVKEGETVDISVTVDKADPPDTNVADNMVEDTQADVPEKDEQADLPEEEVDVFVNPNCPDQACKPGEAVCLSGSRSFCQDVGDGCTRFVTEKCANSTSCSDGKCAQCQDDKDCPQAGKTGCDENNSKYAFTCVTDADNDSCLEKKFKLCQVGCSSTTGDCCTHECKTDETGCIKVADKLRPWTCTAPTLSEPCRRKKLGQPCDETKNEICDATTGRCKLLCPNGMLGIDNKFCMDQFENNTDTGTAVSEKDKTPLHNVSPKKAKALCTEVGKRLCTLQELARSCRGDGDFRFPYGFSINTFQKLSCDNDDLDHPVSDHLTGELSNCTSQEGVTDLTGNLWEISDFTDGETTTVIFGGDWQGTTQEHYSCCADQNLQGGSCQGMSAPNIKIIPVDPNPGDPTQVDSSNGRIIPVGGVTADSVVTGFRCCCTKGECP